MADAEILKWRPHHIYCEQFLDDIFADRGDEYNRVEQKIRETMKSGIGEVIEFTEGVDELCFACPICHDDRCQSPEGDEVQVRKWDGILLRALGVSYGDRMTVAEFRTMAKEKSPLDFCRTKCKMKETCRVFDLE